VGPKAATIEICIGRRNSREDIWRIARLSFDIGTDINWISRKLVTEDLGLEINYCHSKELQGYNYKYNGEDLEGQGYVNLVWCFNTSSRKMFGPTQYMVTSVYDPPFDAVLGRRDLEGARIAKDFG